jgi:hypothetical protein
MHTWRFKKLSGTLDEGAVAVRWTSMYMRWEAGEPVPDLVIEAGNRGEA